MLEALRYPKVRGTDPVITAMQVSNLSEAFEYDIMIISLFGINTREPAVFSRLSLFILLAL